MKREYLKRNKHLKRKNRNSNQNKQEELSLSQQQFMDNLNRKFHR